MSASDSSTTSSPDRSNTSEPEPSDVPALSLGPPAEAYEAIECAYRYPQDLILMPIAFDGTVTSVARGPYVDEAAGFPLDLELSTNEVFRGEPGAAVTMHTFDTSGSEAGDQADLVGLRLLIASSDTMDLMWCGFTRPYTAADAELWSAVYGG